MNPRQETPPTAPLPLPAGAGKPEWVIGICLLLATAVWTVFGQTFGFSFVNFDDNVYVYANPLVRQGLSLHGFLAAFSCANTDNWTPLATISHMLACDLFGVDAGGHHLINVLLHTISAIILFLVLRQMTATLWPAAFVAALFAIHPLRVESVAWVSERKDTLSGVFFMLTLWAYLRYVRCPQSTPRWRAVVLFFVLGLLSKPMLVTVPFVLLLLDYWPLNRFASAAPASHLAIPGLEKFPAASLISEKIPLLAMSLAACLPTLLTERNGIQTGESYPLSLRIANALVSYVTHIERMFWPAHLAAFYPYPSGGLPPGQIIFAILVLAGISATAFACRRKSPWILVGWLWYLGMLVPVIGLVQVGWQAQADRHTYLPQIGLYLLLTWTVTALTARWPNRRWILGAGALAILAALMTCATTLAANWRDNESIWTRAAACTSSNYVAEYNLGLNFFANNQLEQAIPHCQKAAEYSPKAFHLFKNSDSVTFVNDFAWYLATNPDARIRNGPRAVELAEHAVELTHETEPACLGTLAAAYAEAGRFDDATATAQKACALAEKNGELDLLKRNRELLEFYRARQPWHEAPGKPAAATP